MLIRAHYLISPAVGSLGLLILLLYRFDDGLSSAWLPLTAAPYYLLYGRDLNYTGYRWADLFCVYVLNLLLIPINLAGVFRSLQQAVTGKKAAFGRTPKVQCRTRIPAIHVLLQLLLLIYLAGAFLFDFAKGHYTHAVFAFANCIMLFYGISRFLGWREGFADLCHGVRVPLLLKHQAAALDAYLRNRSTLSFKRGRSYARAELNYPSLSIDVDSFRLRARHFPAVKKYRGQVGR
jgi:hypothetical protein